MNLDMKTKKAVSVIITTYNDVDYLVEALESVFAQTYKDYEVIVVDDGSTIDNRSKLGPYLNVINYIYKENGGVSSARNVGIISSKGQYLAFLDSDDLWLPEKLELQVGYFRANPQVGLVYTDANIFNESGIICHSRFHEDIIYDGPHEGMVFEKLFSYNFVPFSSIMVKRSCLAKSGLFDEVGKGIIQDDFDFLLRLARYYSFGYVDRVLAKRRMHGNSLTSNFEMLYERDFATIEKVVALFPELNLRNAKYVKKGVSKFHFNFGLEYLAINAIKSARRQFVAAIISYPYYLRAWLYVVATYLPDIIFGHVRQARIWYRSKARAR